MIENLWAELNRVTLEMKAKNEAEKFDELQRGWQAIPFDYLHTLIENMARRCKAIIKFELY